MQLVISVVLLVASWCAADELPLYELRTMLNKDLLRNYDHNVLPQQNWSKPVTVTMRLAVMGLLDVNEKDGHLTLSLYPHLQWYDPRLTWVVNQSAPVTELFLRQDQLWVPDVDHYTSYSSSNNEDDAGVMLEVRYDGLVTYEPRMKLQTPCHFDLTSFPFDSHTCYVTLDSRSYNVSQVVLRADPFDLRSFNGHSDWEVRNYSLTSGSKSYFYEPKSSFSEITLSLHFVRMGSYFYRLYVAPAAVCMFVIPVIHFLPPNSNEKLTLCGLILVAVVIMFEMLENFFPAFSLENIPLLLHYYTALLMIVFMSLFMSCLSIILGNSTSKSARVPLLLRKFCLDKLGYICCARGRTQRYDYELLHLEKSLREAVHARASGEEALELSDVQSPHTASESDILLNGASSVEGNHQASGSQTGKEDGIVQVLKTLINELQYKRYREQIRMEWMQLAIVLDRVWGVFALFLSICVTAVITMHAKSQ